MPFRDVVINIDSNGSKVLLENHLQYINERIAYAQRLTNTTITLMIDGSTMDRLVWISEAQTEKAKIEAELAKYN